jgi:hypothetical protein
MVMQSRRQVQRHDTEWTENACGIPTLAPSKNQALAETVSGGVLAPLGVDAAGVGVERDRTRRQQVSDTGGLGVGGDHRHTKHRRVAGSYGRPMCSIEFVVDSRGDRRP